MLSTLASHVPAYRSSCKSSRVIGHTQKRCSFRYASMVTLSITRLSESMPLSSILAWKTKSKTGETGLAFWRPTEH
jgi:hypothetical protein